MSILVDESTKLIVQGITGRDGSFHTKQMLDYGTKVVGGVTPGKGGSTEHDLPVFNEVSEAVEKTDANTTVIYVPAKFAKSAAKEAIEAGLKLVVVITEGMPVHDMIEIMHLAKEKGVRIIGPNCPGIISPGKCKIGIMPGHIHMQGNIGVISRSGTLTYEVVYALTANNMGQSTCIGVGGDPVIGSRFVDLLELFNNDQETEGIVLVGEIGGSDEQLASEYIKEHIKKPIVGFIAGKTAPPGKRMGHAGAIISGGESTAESKTAALNSVGVEVASFPDEIPGMLKTQLEKCGLSS